MTQDSTLVACDPPVPHIPFGPHRLSRLIVGANPINGGSHLSRFVNRQMRRYFTPERVLAMLDDCQKVGINTWQSGPQNLDLYTRHRQEGGQLQYISLAREDPQDPDLIARLVKAGTIAIAHHGEVTDTMFKSGQIERIRAFWQSCATPGFWSAYPRIYPTSWIMSRAKIGTWIFT